MLLGHLRRMGDRTALVESQGRHLSYDELADRAAEFAETLGSGRKLVMLAGRNASSSLIAYLGAYIGGHAVLVVPEPGTDPDSSLRTTYDPDVVVTCNELGVTVDRIRDESGHDLHQDLALCLSTSGSTGSPKLVRLSYRNLQSNAAAIAQYLALTRDDRAATTLPMHYCYGLSVIHSYLMTGASLLLTNDSVLDASFWSDFRDHRATSLAGVPYTYELLDKVGFASMALPHLRYLTVSGGRLAPAKLREYAELGRRSGWELFSMYGSTESTSRMSYMPPHLAVDNPECVGVPIPGGEFRIDPVDGLNDGTGELVYRGPNVMMGYANSAADLGKGPELDELRTGDIALRKSNGLYQIVGRAARFVKLFGIRVDLQRIESVLEADGLAVCATGTDDQLVVAVEGSDRVDEVQNARDRRDEPSTPRRERGWRGSHPAARRREAGLFRDS